MTDIISILTNGRRPELYAETLRQVRDQIASVIIPEPKPALAAFPDGAQRGTRAAMRWVMRSVLELPEWERLVYLEDDLLLSDDDPADESEGPTAMAMYVILTTPVPDDCAFVSHCDWHQFPVKVAPGLHRVPAMGFDGSGMWGAQCLVLPRMTVQYVAEQPDAAWDEWQHPVAHYRDPKNGCDAALVYILSKSPWPRYAIRIPTVVKHAGAKRSTISESNNGAHGEEVNFAGRK